MADRQMTLSEISLFCARNMIDLRYGYVGDDFAQNQMTVMLARNPVLERRGGKVLRTVPDRSEITEEQLTTVLNDAIREFRSLSYGVEDV